MTAQRLPQGSMASRREHQGQNSNTLHQRLCQGIALHLHQYSRSGAWMGMQLLQPELWRGASLCNTLIPMHCNIEVQQELVAGQRIAPSMQQSLLTRVAVEACLVRMASWNHLHYKTMFQTQHQNDSGAPAFGCSCLETGKQTKHACWEVLSKTGTDSVDLENTFPCHNEFKDCCVCRLPALCY